ncbi:MAG: box helicase, partial [Frankiales bacterium]|nr:box helicase [Frankiales bacterium]
TGEDADYLGLPGLLTPEQTASLLARRDEEHRRRASTAVDEDEPETGPVEVDRSWEQAGTLRREVNSLVGQLAARTGAPHGVLHGRLRKAVPGPPSAAATTDVLEARRDWLLAQLTR